MQGLSGANNADDRLSSIVWASDRPVSTVIPLGTPRNFCLEQKENRLIHFDLRFARDGKYMISCFDLISRQRDIGAACGGAMLHFFKFWIHSIVSVVSLPERHWSLDTRWVMEHLNCVSSIRQLYEMSLLWRYSVISMMCSPYLNLVRPQLSGYLRSSYRASSDGISWARSAFSLKHCHGQKVRERSLESYSFLFKHHDFPFQFLMINLSQTAKTFGDIWSSTSLQFCREYPGDIGPKVRRDGGAIVSSERT